MKKTRRFLSDRGIRAVTIDLAELSPNCCVGRLPDVRVHPGPPGDPGAYRHFHAGGLDIHVAKGLNTEKALRLHLSGWGPFHKLEVSGLNLFL